MALGDLGRFWSYSRLIMENRRRPVGALTFLAVPTDPPNLARPQSSAIVADADPSVVLCLERHRPLLEAAPRRSDTVHPIMALATDTVQTEPSSYRAPVIERDQVCFLQYTSGSTNRPKG